MRHGETWELGGKHCEDVIFWENIIKKNDSLGGEGGRKLAEGGLGLTRGREGMGTKGEAGQELHLS